MSGVIEMKRLEILQAMRDLAEQQRHALESDDLDEFLRLLGEREEMLVALEALQDNWASGKVVPFPLARARRMVPGDPQAAVAALLQDVFALDRASELLLAQKMNEVEAALGEVARGQRAMRGYRGAARRGGQVVDRVG